MKYAFLFSFYLIICCLWGCSQAVQPESPALRYVYHPAGLSLYADPTNNHAQSVIPYGKPVRLLLNPDTPYPVWIAHMDSYRTQVEYQGRQGWVLFAYLGLLPPPSRNVTLSEYLHTRLQPAGPPQITHTAFSNGTEIREVQLFSQGIQYTRLVRQYTQDQPQEISETCFLPVFSRVEEAWVLLAALGYFHNGLGLHIPGSASGRENLSGYEIQSSRDRLVISGYGKLFTLSAGPAGVLITIR